jgi:alpha-glucosidase
MPVSETWWRSGVLYQIYPRSWSDSDGDGVGDLRGLIGRLDYLAWLGVDGLWLNPITRSPNADWGYDVSDYCDVDPSLGDLADLDELIAGASSRGLRVVLDLVPNHTSDRHQWFIDARTGRAARHRDYYVWADPGPDGSPPNNWQSAFGGGPAWTFDDRSGQYYMHNFLSQQPDLNWWNEDVRAEFDAILRFWFDRGVAGFRIDVAHALIKDRDLRDNPAATPNDHPEVIRQGQRFNYSMNRPETHEIFHHWRKLSDSYDPQRVLIGETYVLDLQRMSSYYGTGADELHLALNFPFLFSRFGVPELKNVVEETYRLLPQDAWPVWAASNHDAGRFPSRWCEGDSQQVRCALMLLLTLRGTPILYYGDEIGMPDVHIDPEARRDPAGRDKGRTPMQWSSKPGGGFTRPSVKRKPNSAPAEKESQFRPRRSRGMPWLPLGDHATDNVMDQRDDPASVLTLCRDLIALRRREPGLNSGAYEAIASPTGAWMFRRNGHTVALNLSDDKVVMDAPDATVVIGTRRGRDGEQIRHRLSLAPWEGVVLA